MQQMYQCPSCGRPVAFGTRFCGNCGTSFTWQQQMPPPPLYNQSGSYQQQAPPYYQQPSSDVHSHKKRKKMSAWNWAEFACGLLALALGIFGSYMSIQDYGYIQPKLIGAIVFGVGMLLYLMLKK